MSWALILMLVFGTALLSSLITTILLGLFSDRWIRSRLEKQANEAGEAVAKKVGKAVEASIEDAYPRLREEVARGITEGGEELLPRFRAEVEKGVADAGERLLPRFREQVREGFQEAIAGGVLGKAGEELARRGGSVIDAGLDILLGKRDKDD